MSCAQFSELNNYSGQIATVYRVGCVIECAVCQAITVEPFLSWCAHRVLRDGESNPVSRETGGDTYHYMYAINALICNTGTEQFANACYSSVLLANTELLNLYCYCCKVFSLHDKT